MVILNQAKLILAVVSSFYGKQVSTLIHELCALTLPNP
jgi:hypothetical protein